MQQPAKAREAFAWSLKGKNHRVSEGPSMQKMLFSALLDHRSGSSIETAPWHSCIILCQRPRLTLTFSYCFQCELSRFQFPFGAVLPPTILLKGTTRRKVRNCQRVSVGRNKSISRPINLLSASILSTSCAGDHGAVAQPFPT